MHSLPARDSLHAELARLRERNEYLEECERLRRAESDHEPLIFPRAWGLERKERLIVLALMNAPNGFLTKKKLFDQVWGVESECQEKAIGVYICRLRKVFRDEDIAIETVWSSGYRLPQNAIAKIRARCAEAATEPVSHAEGYWAKRKKRG